MTYTEFIEAIEKENEHFANDVWRIVDDHMAEMRRIFPWLEEDEIKNGGPTWTQRH